MALYRPPQHARRENNFYKTQLELAAGLLAGLRRAGLTLPAPLHDPCAGDAALLDGLGLRPRVTTRPTTPSPKP